MLNRMVYTLNYLALITCPTPDAGTTEVYGVMNDDTEHAFQSDGTYEYQPGDLTMYLDYSNDELDIIGAEALSEWYYNIYQHAINIMDAHGYGVVFEHDGSGSGLYYGSIIFRMR